ncbi:hypothetical protein L873DRAFT_1807463 [Choiromyces venosus 120613-1]|uniref:Uncharacterized protein n=1 Tax=Choiromyces venosus 120613-1 TaxID=1336337 RepID=A0A3N4JLA0_9PEZI|nr:hypothetical protein L873DRAFT_1807463 [Choiromyces venosus 120613-1]
MQQVISSGMTMYIRCLSNARELKRIIYIPHKYHRVLPRVHISIAVQSLCNDEKEASSQVLVYQVLP